MTQQAPSGSTKCPRTGMWRVVVTPAEQRSGDVLEVRINGAKVFPERAHGGPQGVVWRSTPFDSVVQAVNVGDEVTATMVRGDGEVGPMSVPFKMVLESS